MQTICKPVRNNTADNPDNQQTDTVEELKREPENDEEEKDNKQQPKSIKKNPD